MVEITIDHCQNPFECKKCVQACPFNVIALDPVELESHEVVKKMADYHDDELEWRFNNRDNPYLFRDTLLKLINSTNLSYQELTQP